MARFSSLPGFRDFYPEMLAVRRHLMDAWRAASLRFGFKEYDGPPLESLELYVEKSGEEIVGQLYHFEDKGGRAVALRPEMTPTLARMVGARARAMRKPVRWFSMPQLFRYERTQRGRLREHFQWNVDIIGEADVAADAEVLAVALTALRTLGLGPTDVVARVSDRRLLEALLLHAGVARDRLPAAYAAIDKLGREAETATGEKLERDAGLDAGHVAEIFRIFEHRDLDGLADAYAGVAGVEVELERLRVFFAAMDELGLAEYTAFDPRIVRGLAYYTGIVYEVFDRQGELRAVCGGGRYDDLLAAIGSEPMAAAGFGMGDVVLAELLADRGLLPEYASRPDYYIVAITESERSHVRKLAGALRGAGRTVVYSLRAAGVGRQFREADGLGASHAIVLGPQEVEEGTAVVRDMRGGAERRLRLEDLLK